MSVHFPDLGNHVVVVPGGTGNVGEGVVRALLQSGARVVVPSHHQSRLELLAALIEPELRDRLVSVHAPYSSFAEAEVLAERVGALNPTDVVSSVGTWWHGKHLWRANQTDWHEAFVSPLTTQFALMRAFLPALPELGSYTFINGFSATEGYTAAGLVSMRGSAQLMMRQVLSRELGATRRVNDVVFGPLLTRERSEDADFEHLHNTADDAGLLVSRIVANRNIHDQTIDVQTPELFQAWVEAI